MDKEIFNYRKLVAYQRAKVLVKEVYGLLNKFPRNVNTINKQLGDLFEELSEY